MLFARAVGLVEGDTERGYFQELGPRIGHDFDSRCVSIVNVDGEGDFTTNLRYLEALGIPTCCFRDKPVAGSGIHAKYHPLFQTHEGKEFEQFMEDAGLRDLLQEAKNEVGNSKARVGRYVGRKIELSKVPEIHKQFAKKLTDLT
jgi:predicted ATP-dependent endonuclease of OLD family